MKSCQRTLIASLLLAFMTAAHGQWTATNLNGTNYESMAFALAGQNQYGAYDSGSGLDTFARACRWTGNEGSITDILTPAATTSTILSARRNFSNTTLSGSIEIAGIQYGAVWRGSNMPSLHLPAGDQVSAITSTTDGRFVGFSRTAGGRNRAGLWRTINPNDDTVYLDLSPLNSVESAVLGNITNVQVGYATSPGGLPNASRWNNTVASHVSLNPAGATQSIAYGITTDPSPVPTGPTKIVGFAEFFGQSNAGTWTGNSSTWVNLHPAVATNSEARAASPLYEVGFATVGGVRSASFWAGSKSSWVNLHAFLPEGYSASEATGVLVDGSGISVVGHATEVATGKKRAFLWNRPLPTVSGQITLQDTATTGPYPSESIVYRMQKGGSTVGSGASVNAFGGGSYTFTIPFLTSGGPATLSFSGGTFLATRVPITLTGEDITINVSLRNGDIDQDGEVGPGDFERVVAQFGNAGPADCDNDGTVGPADFEIVVRNFGEVAN